jgi:hypothetical protein
MTAGDLKVSTIQFDDVTTKTSGKTSAGASAVTTSVIVEGTATGAGSTTATKPSWAGFIK